MTSNFEFPIKTTSTKALLNDCSNKVQLGAKRSVSSW